MAVADFCTTAELLTYMRTDATGVDAVTSGVAITAASDLIRNATNRDFNIQDAAPTTRYFTPYKAGDTRAFSSFPWNPGAWGFLPYFFYPIPATPDRILPIDDLFLTGQILGDLVFTNVATAAALTVDRLWPFNAGAHGQPYEAALFAPGTIIPDGEGAISLLAKFGYPTAAPTTIKQACLIQASRFVKRRDSPLGVAGIAEMGGVLRLQAKLDPDVEGIVSAYRRWWAAA